MELVVLLTIVNAVSLHIFHADPIFIAFTLVVAGLI